MNLIILSLVDFDELMLQWINRDIANPVFDILLPFVRNKYSWAPLYAFIIAFCFFNMPLRRAAIFLALAFATVGSTDFVSSTIIKNTIQRLRPCNALEHDAWLEVRAKCGNGYSFTSSHAANHFGIAVFLFLTLGRTMRGFKWPFIVWASIISFAQVYVGVHYPLDILAGAIVGILFGRLIANIYMHYFQHSGFEYP